MAVRERETRERDTRAAIAPTNAPATAPWPTLAANVRWCLLLSPYRRPSSARAAARLRGPRPNATAAESVMVRRFRRATRVRGPQARQRAMPGFRTAACSAAARASGNVQVGMCKWEHAGLSNGSVLSSSASGDAGTAEECACADKPRPLLRAEADARADAGRSACRSTVVSLCFGSVHRIGALCGADNPQASSPCVLVCARA